jgi:PAS domain S-box-containing protein
MANREWERVLGWKLKEIRGREVLAEAHPDPDERAEVRAFMTSATSEWRCFPTRSQDGRIVDCCWTHVRLSDGRTIGIGEDMTERRNAEQVRQATEERFRLLVENSSEMISVLDRDGTIRYQSGAVERILGYRPEDLATAQAFRNDPRLVWEWYEWRRGLARESQPNPGHRALAELEQRYPNFSVITQNVDGLHRRAGARNVIDIHGDLHRLRCMRCLYRQTVEDYSALTFWLSPLRSRGIISERCKVE